MSRKITIKELKKMIHEALGPMRAVNAMKIKVQPWWKAEPENDVDWMKALKIKELVGPKKK
jgi:hypothetical protein